MHGKQERVDGYALKAVAGCTAQHDAKREVTLNRG